MGKDEKPALPANISVASLNPAEKDGWLTKQGGSIRTWKKRWFVLKDAKLYYFKNPKDTEVTGIIPLDKSSACKEEAFEMRKKKNLFSVRPSDQAKRVYFIYSDKPEDTKGWLTKITESIAKTSSSGQSSNAPSMRLTETQPQSKPAQATASSTPKAALTPGIAAANDARGLMTQAKDEVPFLQDPESKVLEFWQIWFESIPTEEDLQSVAADLATSATLDFAVSVSITFEKLTWRSAGPQSGFIQKMVDFFWNVGAPEVEIDRLNDVGTMLNPIKIGSWIDMSGGGGMDGGWYFPVDASLANALNVPDAGDAIPKITEWASTHDVNSAVYIGRDMGAVPPRQTEIRVVMPGNDVAHQLKIALNAFEVFGFEMVPDEAVQIMKSMTTAGIIVSIITSSEGFVRLGIIMPRPNPENITKLIAFGGGNKEHYDKLCKSVSKTAPSAIEFLHLKQGYGYSVYKEGFDIVLHFQLNE
eukprot:TRINITY_DN10951_c0_g1_i1.p1 TRINITY_DN10951_c0_g1~~TRINITY_DN10951_c0_g1_i1.p1  ORF type:complete len:473 (-),score=100.72 TRINITY_DN10951_c0_g1_i1:93-1511(-)